MRRKALLMGVVAAAALLLSASATASQVPEAPPRAPKSAAQPTPINPRWQVQPEAATPPAATTPQTTRGYTEFDELLTPREWPRDDPINAMPEMPGDRLDDQFGLTIPPGYETPRPTKPLGPD